MSQGAAPQPHEARSMEQMFGLVYDELRRLANHQLAQIQPGQTLQPTAVVHDAYVKLAGQRREAWEGRTIFFKAAARAMRDVIVDHARRNHAAKRGGGRQRIDLDDASPFVNPEDVDVVALDAALNKLAAEEARLSELVTLRFFAGASLEQAAESLGVSLATANRDWRYAKAWLREELDRTATPGPESHPKA